MKTLFRSQRLDHRAVKENLVSAWMYEVQPEDEADPSEAVTATDRFRAYPEDEREEPPLLVLRIPPPDAPKVNEEAVAEPTGPLYVPRPTIRTVYGIFLRRLLPGLFPFKRSAFIRGLPDEKITPKAAQALYYELVARKGEFVRLLCGDLPTREAYKTRKPRTYKGGQEVQAPAPTPTFAWEGNLPKKPPTRLL